MKHKKLVFISLVLILLNLNLFSQKDTTICFEINSQENRVIMNSVFGIDVCYANSYNPAPMLGIHYERITSKSNTFSFSAGTNKYPNRRYAENINYFKFEYRFYFPDTRIPKASSFNNEFYLQKKKMALSAPEGLFIGIAAVFQNFETEKTSNSIIAGNKYYNSYGIGGNIGYQFQLFWRIHTIISLPLVVEFRNERNVKSKEIGIDLSALININFGIAF